MKCPICDKDLVRSGDMREDGDERCPDKHYWYNHSYGNHELVLDLYGDGHATLSLGWSYSISCEQSDAIDKAIDSFVKYAKVVRESK